MFMNDEISNSITCNC